MSGTDPLPAFRQAATVLLAEAPLPVVRATLRALLAETEMAATPPVAARSRPAMGANPLTGCPPGNVLQPLTIVLLAR
jgi:hypothetical protein